MRKNPYHYKWTDLTVEPSLVEPEPPVVGFNIHLHRLRNHHHSAFRKTPRIANDHPLETREEAIEFALEYFGVTIEEVKPIDKRGLHFE